MAKAKGKNRLLLTIFLMLSLGAAFSFAIKAAGRSPPLYVSVILVALALVVLELRTGVYRSLFHKKDCKQ